jgi:hypothetical protein
MVATHGHVMSDQIAITNEVMVFDPGVAEIASYGLEDLLPSATPLRASGVVDHVLGDKLVDDRLVTGLTSSKQFLDDLACALVVHVTVGHP